MTRGSVSLSCATTQTLPAFLNLNDTILVFFGFFSVKKAYFLINKTFRNFKEQGLDQKLLKKQKS